MKKEDLRQLKGLQNEIELLKKNKEEREKEVKMFHAHLDPETVKMEIDTLDAKIRERAQLINQFESWIETVPDIDMRSIIRCVYRLGMSQKQTAMIMGQGWTRASIAKRIERFFSNKNIT